MHGLSQLKGAFCRSAEYDLGTRAYVNVQKLLGSLYVLCCGDLSNSPTEHKHAASINDRMLVLAHQMATKQKLHATQKQTTLECHQADVTVCSCPAKSMLALLLQQICVTQL